MPEYLQVELAKPSVRGACRWLAPVLLITALLGVGLWLRSVPPLRGASGVAKGWPWTMRSAVTLYFSDGGFLFPVSRRIPIQDDKPRAVLQALLAGPSATSGLTSALPRGLTVRSLQLAGGVAQIDLTAVGAAEQGLTREGQAAIVETMTALPGVNSVALSLEGMPLDLAKRTPLLYFASGDGLAAVPVAVGTPRAAIETYLAGPPDPRLTGLPRDVQLRKFDYIASAQLVSLHFSYTPSLRALALEHPERVRFVLLGLVASLTEFAEVRTVQLDFDGRTRLGLGQCSDLLDAPQQRPELLNDERLLGR